ncbi:type IIL restriction-modification enzyme MmeI, partial [Hymenobacter lapidiphilus]|uniref:type IIL restriction-modification enzyme MmeI n=1 Tax=Hymenobacter sp. CCM 8763 TaxID=2303334 RepID=UPI00293D4626
MTVAERTPATPLPGLLLTLRTETAAKGDDAAEVTFETQEGLIQPDLTIGADLDSARPLKALENLSSPGVKLHGQGFVLTAEKARFLGLGSIEGLDTYIRPYFSGKDFTERNRKQFVIDLFGLSSEQVLNYFPTVYQHLLEQVKPERDAKGQTKDGAGYAKLWWLFGKPRQDLRPALQAIRRYIATVVTAKHRVFQFLDKDILAEDALIVIASEDAYHLGVLSSRFHVVWALAVGAILGVGATPRYRKSRTFDPFPFPEATAEQQARIRELAEQLDAHRKRQQAAHPTLTLTDLYNVVEKLRAGQPLATPKDQTVNQQGLASVVLSLHQQLDAAVAAAYNWPPALPEAEPAGPPRGPQPRPRPGGKSRPRPLPAPRLPGPRAAAA